MSRPRGERWTGSAFNAQRWKSSQGGPQSDGVKLACDAIDQLLGPAVERIGQTVAKFRRGYQAGGVSYLVKQAESNPTAFLTLVGKIIPAQIDATVNKRDVTELSRDELLALIAETRAASGRAAPAGGREDEPPQVH
jgi:hypothetical protein